MRNFMSFNSLYWYSDRSFVTFQYWHPLLILINLQSSSTGLWRSHGGQMVGCRNLNGPLCHMPLKTYASSNSIGNSTPCESTQVILTTTLKTSIPEYDICLLSHFFSNGLLSLVTYIDPFNFEHLIAQQSPAHNDSPGGFRAHWN